ncbi:hypothetical protein AALB52_17975 [Lachnospiraceae bacterium 38-14]|uniref:DUF2281 domain-containing protein n=1 Tax=Roseburia sp. 1XD42-69 TaxID=2320088 RepID=UPI000EA3013F|nr:DUF2281 domain-containing protein [Roseburia sp. 1XD42-69]RKJ64912.1 DUF2281 domain-containing protein [Roseburia sp. 1XD42-69]
METKQIITNLISQVPESKLDTILAFVKFILLEEENVNNSLLSEPSLAKDWMSKEEDTAWQNL